MKSLLLLAASAGLLAAQSNPSWWKYIPPEATSVAGMQWPELQASVFGAAVAEELLPGGSLGFPDLPILRTPQQVLIGAPGLLAIEYGKFAVSQLREQAAAQGMQRGSYRGTELWISAQPNLLSVAFVSEQLLLVGSVAAIQDALTRVSDPKNRLYSPLLARGARYAQEDLWVVSRRLPDPLASLFVPLEIDATAFEGALSMWNGLHLVAAIERPSPSHALDLADDLAEILAGRPTVSEGAEISTKDRSVLIRIDLDERQLAASLRGAPAQPTLVASAAPAKPQPRIFVPPAASPAAPSVPPATPAPEAALPEVTMEAAVAGSQPAIQAALPPGPKVVRILGLASGPREIVLNK